MRERQRLRVECYSGYRGDETPRRFYLGERCLEVTDVVDRWLAPEHRYFKCLADDGATYILRHDVATDTWDLKFYVRSTGA